MVGSSQLQYSSLMAMAMLLLLPLAGTEAIAAPGNVSWNTSTKSITYTAKGYSQVELKWPKSGVVCRHNQTTSRRTCRNLVPGEHYKIVDFADNGKRYFQFPKIQSRDLKPFICRAGSRGNLTNIRFGLNTKWEYFIAWDRKRSPSWIQLQHQNPYGGIASQGMGNIKTRLKPDVTYRLDDLTYGGRVYIDLKKNGC